MRKTIVAGNWKMNGTLAGSIELAKELGRVLSRQKLNRVRPVVFPPALYLIAVGQQIRDTGIELGGQDCSTAAAGSFTGDVSAPMLRESGCRFVIVGHSERRRFHGETSDTVRAKAAAAMAHQLTPIICVGEDASGLAQADLRSTLGAQVIGSVPADAHLNLPVIAYEPLWAIGAAASATPRHIEVAHAAIRSTLVDLLGPAVGEQVAILYGGSVNPGNCADLFSVDNIDGVLVGRSSMNADQFVALVAAAEDRRRREEGGGQALDQ